MINEIRWQLIYLVLFKFLANYSFVIPRGFCLFLERVSACIKSEHGRRKVNSGMFKNEHDPVSLGSKLSLVDNRNIEK